MRLVREPESRLLLLLLDDRAHVIRMLHGSIQSRYRPCRMLLLHGVYAPP